jgi:hypothetical protein
VSPSEPSETRSAAAGSSSSTSHSNVSKPPARIRRPHSGHARSGAASRPISRSPRSRLAPHATHDTRRANG